MIISCPACATRYDLPDGAIPAVGRTVRCASCRNSWFQPGDGSAEAESAAVESGAVESGPAESTAESTARAPLVRSIPPLLPQPADEAGVTLVVPAATPPPVFERLPLVAPASTEPTGQIRPAPADAHADAYPDDSRSSFAYEAPFAPRRRRWKTWLLAVLAFVLLLAAIAAAAVWYGAPDWLPFGQSTFGRSALVKARPGLVLDFPRDRVERRTLADGTEFFGARGTITNTGASRRAVPPLLIVLRDRQRREVYRWEVISPKPQLGPGETMTIDEAVTDIPRSATEPEIGWAA